MLMFKGMKQKLESLLQDAVSTLQTQGVVDASSEVRIHIERVRDPQNGDFATNLAMLLAKPAKMNPRQLAEKIVSLLPTDNGISKVEIAGPGFINFFINPDHQFQVVKQIF